MNYLCFATYRCWHPCLKYKILTHCIVVWYRNGESEHASRILIPRVADAKLIFPQYILYRKASDVSYVSSMGSKPIDIRWIRNCSQLY